MTQVTAGAQSAPSQSPESEDSLGSIRPRLRHDVVFADTGIGAFVRNTDTGFLIRGKTAYRWLSTLAPHFNGELTVGELCEGLAEDRQALITSMVRTLLERGFASDKVDGDPVELPAEILDRYARQISFIEHYADNAPRRFEIYRNASVLVVGTGELARAAEQALLRNGSSRVTVCAPGELADAAAHDMIIVCATETGAGVVSQLCADLAPGGPSVLPISTVGRNIIFGPLTRHGCSPCWNCLLLRLDNNIDAADMARLWREIALGTPAAGALPSANVAQIAGTTAAFDAFRLLTGSLIGESAGAVLMIDTETLESTRERLLPHPSCPSCRGDGPPAAAGPYPGEEAFDPEGQTPDQLYERLATLVRERVGVVRDFTDQDLPQSPLKVARCRMGRGRELAAFDVETLLNARQALAHRAALTYVDELADLRRALPETEVPADLLMAAGSLALATGAAVPAGPHLPATDLHSGESFWVPASAVHTLAEVNEGTAFEPTSAGLGAGLDLAAATERGLFSALAFEGLRRAVRGEPVRQIELEGASTEIAFLLAAAGHLGTTVKVYALPGAAPAPAVLAVAEGPDGAVRWSATAAASAQAASVEAMRDVIGQVQLAAEGAAADLGAELLPELSLAALKVDGTTGLSGTTVSFAELLDALHAGGRRALRAQTTTPDLELLGTVSTVRVLLAAQ